MFRGKSMSENRRRKFVRFYSQSFRGRPKQAAIFSFFEPPTTDASDMFFEKQVFLNNVIGLIWKELILFIPLEVTGLASSSTYDVLVSFTASVSYDTLRHSYYSHLWDFFLVIFVVKFLLIFNFLVERFFSAAILVQKERFQMSEIWSLLISCSLLSW